MGKLNNKVSVITGGNSGIGFGIEEAFLKEGAVGSIIGKNEVTLAHAVDVLVNEFMGISGNVTSMSDLENIFKKAADIYGKIDALVVNAGGIVDDVPMAMINDVTEENYHRYTDWVECSISCRT